MKTAKIFALLLLMLPAIAQAWWDKDWKQRTAITLNTSAAGVQTQQAVTGITVPVRLHSGNFDFLSAKQDGSDLRVVAGDDKTPLKFWIERFDGINELGILWVQLPSVMASSDKNVFYVYAGNDKAPADTANAAIFDPSTVAVFHFAEKDGIAADTTGTIKATVAVPLEPNGLIGQGAHIDGTAVTWPANDKLKAPAAGPLSIAFWIKPDTAAGTLFHQGSSRIVLKSGALSAQVGKTTVAGGQIAPATWSQVALTIGGGKATLYVNGAQTGQGDLDPQAPAIEGDLQVGEGYQGLFDELEVASTVRTAEWVKLSYAAQSADAKLVATKTETADSATSDSGGSPNYFGILIKSLTPDAWVVIGILAVMFLVAVLVMITKAIYVNRTENANRRFITMFRDAKDVLLVETGQGAFNDSSLYRLYRAGLVELTKRDVGKDGRPLSGASIDAVKAAVDADSVREGYKLNAQMVLLTIAIAGGPFLGLLGTVVGVMITFAAIAAAGDVNVNAIAPGIAAALLATVAGLSVAIPALFGYNYLASRIKTISSDMQIFVDEFVTRVAEAYGAR
jgi:biopolymer transport protein ExbB